MNTRTIIILCTLTLFLAGMPLIAGAQEFQPLVPDLPVYQAGEERSFTAFARGFFNLTIGIAAVLAVIMIIIGGLEYMSTEAVTGKGDAKSRIQAAVWGLLIAIFAWIILSTINPDILNTDFENTPTNETITLDQPAFYYFEYAYSRYVIHYLHTTTRVRYTDVITGEPKEEYFTTRSAAENFIEEDALENPTIQTVPALLDNGEVRAETEEFPGTDNGKVLCEERLAKLREQQAPPQLSIALKHTPDAPCALASQNIWQSSQSFISREACLQKMSLYRQFSNITI